MNQPGVTIAIVNYRTREALHDCLRSLERVKDEVTLRIVVVDNASGDGSVELIAARFPEVELIPNSTNVGFARAINQAFVRCSTPFFMFLNPDTWVARHSISRMVETLGQDPKIAVVGAQLTALGGDPQPSVLAAPTLFKEFWNLLPELKSLLFLTPLQRAVARNRESRQGAQVMVEAVSGGALMVRSDAFREIGGLDDRFFLYHEEVDMCLALRQRGYRIVLAPDARILHHDALASGFRASKLPADPVLTWRLMGKKLLFEKHGTKSQVKRYEQMASVLLNLRANACRLLAIFHVAHRSALRARADELAKAAKRLSQEHFPQPCPHPAHPAHT